MNRILALGLCLPLLAACAGPAVLGIVESNPGIYTVTVQAPRGQPAAADARALEAAREHCGQIGSEPAILSTRGGLDSERRVEVSLVYRCPADRLPENSMAPSSTEPYFSLNRSST